MSNDPITIVVFTIVLFVIATIVILLLVFVPTLIWVRNLRRKREGALQERFPNARMVISSASFFGQQSLGVMQARGSGTLVLTDDTLIFERWMPRREYTIPLDHITAIETPSAFLGKSNMQPLLKVVYRTDDGQDAMAWLVRDLSGIKALLEPEIRR